MWILYFYTFYRLTNLPTQMLAIHQALNVTNKGQHIPQYEGS